MYIEIDGFSLVLDKAPANLTWTSQQSDAYESGAEFRTRYGEWSKVKSDRCAYEDEDLFLRLVRAEHDPILARFVKAGKRGDMPRYRLALRYGDIPANGCSTNWATGECERGVSIVCFLDEAGVNTQSKTVYDAVYGIQGTKKYIIGGWDFGVFGSDGEPLLVAAEIIFPADEAGRIKRVSNT